jgi:hypothetical protein
MTNDRVPAFIEDGNYSSVHISDFSLLMVVGGYNRAFLDDVEFIDLSAENTVCAKPSKFPYPAADAIGFFFKNQPWVCGGEESISSTKKDCYAYNANTDKWVKKTSMLEERVYAAANPIREGKELWITGKP